jgi:hypothetical protein
MFLDYNLTRFSAFTILEALLDNGIPRQGSRPADIARLYLDVHEILRLFLNDVRSLDFTPLELATSVLIYTSESLSKHLSKSIWYLIKHIYEMESYAMITNALVVLRR